MKKISVIFGTRPEAIKLASVILALREAPQLDCRVCVTGQHREMLDQVLEVFGIIPDTDLNLMEANQSLARFATKALRRLDEYILEEKPDLVLVQGDTTTTFAGALAAYYHQIPVGHIEAGLRTGKLYSPWPEEGNRILTSHLAALHFAPTEKSRRNLLREGIGSEKIFVTGNTVIDSLHIALEKVKSCPPEIPCLSREIQAEWTRGRIVLITGHRRENFGDGFESICLAIAELSKRFPDVQFVYPVHLNPNVREPVSRILGTQERNNIHLLEPLSYLSFVALMNYASLILTDSGGIQEEAPSLGKPVLVMRDATERPEAVIAGTVKIVGTDYGTILRDTARLLTDDSEYARMAEASNPYGDGKAASRIVRVLSEVFAPQKETAYGASYSHLRT